MLNWLKMGAAAVTGALLAFGPAFYAGQRSERATLAVRAAEATINNLKLRGKIDEEISSGDIRMLCGSYGLSDDETGECVRRLEAIDADTRNRTQDNDG